MRRAAFERLVVAAIRNSLVANSGLRAVAAIAAGYADDTNLDIWLSVELRQRQRTSKIVRARPTKDGGGGGTRQVGCLLVRIRRHLSWRPIDRFVYTYRPVFVSSEVLQLLSTIVISARPNPTPTCPA